MQSASQFAKRVGRSKQAILANLEAISPPPKKTRYKSKKSGRWVPKIEIDEHATYNPKAPGRPRKDK